MCYKLPMEKWELEPNIKFGRYRKHKWMVLRHNDMGFLCGYVAVRPNQAYHGCHYDSVPARFIEAHGGLTFAGTFTRKRIIERYPDLGTDFNRFIRKDDWWLGYDCGHAGDLSPLMGLRGLSFYDDTYRDMEYCENQCREMIDQIHNLKLRKYYFDVSDRRWDEEDNFTQWAIENLVVGEYHPSGYFTTDNDKEYMLIKLTWG